MTKTVLETLQEANSKHKKSDRIEVLQSQQTKALRTILKGAFDPEVGFIVPACRPKCKYRQENEKGVTTIDHIINRNDLWHHLTDRGPVNNDPARAYSIWIQCLEALSLEEAEVLLSVKDKTLHEIFTKISHEVAHEAFPDSVPCPPKPEKKTEDVEVPNDSGE